MIKKLLCFPILTVLVALASVSPVVAVDVLQPGCEGVTNSTLCGEAQKNQTIQDNGLFGVNGILNKAANFLLVIVGIAAVIMIMIGGIQYVLSSGDPQRINGAKDMIIYALVGLVVALIAKGIIAFVINRVA
jgi:hypothetical protein